MFAIGFTNIWFSSKLDLLPKLYALGVEFLVIESVWESIFNESSEKLATKILAAWFEVTCRAKGAEWVAEKLLEMPLKVWAAAEVSIEKYGDDQMIINKAAAKLKAGTASSDFIVWLWNKFVNEVYDNLIDDYIHLNNHHSHELERINDEITNKHSIFNACKISKCIFTSRHHNQISKTNENTLTRKKSLQ